MHKDTSIVSGIQELVGPIMGVYVMTFPKYTQTTKVEVTTDNCTKYVNQWNPVSVYTAAGAILLLQRRFVMYVFSSVVPLDLTV